MDFSPSSGLKLPLASVPNLPQRQPLRRGGPSRFGPDRLRIDLAAADLDQRAGDAADHVAEKTVRGDGDGDAVAVTRHVDPLDGPRRGADLRLDDGERREI